MVFGWVCYSWWIGFSICFSCLVAISFSRHTLRLCQLCFPSRYDGRDSSAVASIPLLLHLHRPTTPDTQQHTPSCLSDRKWHFKALHQCGVDFSICGDVNRTQPSGWFWIPQLLLLLNMKTCRVVCLATRSSHTQKTRGLAVTTIHVSVLV